ncbi:MAG: DNA polymerase III subunit gamma/tau [Eubacterium sp.]|nr:DNA polymerase III subunit gamma/tau [Eubacterium sp.]
MSYTALYRKFRPTTFDEVKGQDAIVTTLKNQIAAGRIGHAYIFTGTRGTGKTTVAKILARAVNCDHRTDGSPCNECETCKEILSGNSTNVVEIDAASNNGVDNIRQIREEVAYRPTSGHYKVYIIDEAHMLSPGAFNALLKTLEEPPEYVIFILATTEINRIPITILSRCQRYNFHRITIDTIAARLKELLEREGVKAEDKAVRYIARAADGSMRDALSLLDQCIAFYIGQELTYDKVLHVLGTVDTDVFSRLLRKIVVSDAAGALQVLDDIIRQGKEMNQIVSDFTWYLRNLMLVQSSSDLEDALDVSTENLQQLREEALMVPSDVLVRYIRIFSELSNQMKLSTQKRILAETALIRLCKPQMEVDTDSLLDRIRVLEKEVEDLKKKAASGAFTSAASGGGAQAGQDGNSGKSAGAADGMGTGGTGRYGQAGAAADSLLLEKAAPEDMKLVRAKWKKIVARITDEPLHTFLDSVTLKYDAETGANVLYLVAPNRITYTLLNRDESRKRISELISENAGKQVQVEIQERDAGSGSLRDIPLEEIFETNFGMNVEEYSTDEEVENLEAEREDDERYEEKYGSDQE